MIAAELQRLLAEKGHQANVHHIDDVEPREIAPADLYIFGSPTRFGGPIGSMRRFCKKAPLDPSTRYAIFATHADAVPNKKTGKMPLEEELNRERKTIPELDEILENKGMVKVADQVFNVSGDVMKGKLKEGWQAKAKEFTAAILVSL